MNTAMATTSLSLQGRPSHAPTRKLSSPFLGAPASFLRALAPAPAAGPSSRRTLAVRAMAPPKPGGKAKKVVGLIKLALEAGKATPAPPVGPALGAKGVNIMAFCKEYNAKTADKPGYIIPVEITVFDDKSFTFVLKTPPASVLLLKAADLRFSVHRSRKERSPGAAAAAAAASEKMDGRSGSECKEARTAAGSGSSDDRISALPLELRAQIASLLSFDEAVQLTVLSPAWRHILLYTPVVEIYLTAFLSVRGILDEDSILAVRVALGRRAQEASSSKVDTLRLVSDIDDRRMRRHAARIIALADARVIRFLAPLVVRDADARDDAWSLDLPPAARELEVRTMRHLAPAIVGPGAAALLKLRLEHAVLTEWPRLPSLVLLDLYNITVEAPFAPGAWCPLLEHLKLLSCDIRQARVDIRLPRLKVLDMDTVDVAPHGQSTTLAAPYGVITIDAPELIQLAIDCGVGVTTDYKSFTLRAPRLRFFCWRNQYSERMDIDVGRPGSVRSGGITLMSVYPRAMMHYREQMMRMLQGLLPNIPPEKLDDVAKPYLTLEDWSDSEYCDDEPKDENQKELTCDLKGLIMSHGI